MSLLDRCIEALGKQEPKRVLILENFYVCPVCGGGEEFLVYETDIYIRFNYCANCGQRLKWEDPEVGQYLERKCKLSSLYGTVVSESEDKNNG